VTTRVISLLSVEGNVHIFISISLDGLTHASRDDENHKNWILFPRQ
jgi:hypothetical protein